jgi:transcription initiation factor TFIIIB Brf1 subunit/transcription initiation factor TFIIB
MGGPHKKEFKTCKICNATKTIPEFAMHERRCKDCMKVIRRDYYIKNIKSSEPKKRGRKPKNRTNGDISQQIDTD